jgi:hypothetical protein
MSASMIGIVEQKHNSGVDAPGEELPNRLWYVRGFSIGFGRFKALGCFW